jgi:cobalt-zinc-cadmium efflux system protein
MNHTHAEPDQIHDHHEGDHGHNHDHSQHSGDNGNIHNHTHHHGSLKGGKLGIAIAVNLLITIAQLIGGFISGSLALYSDALHNFSDVIALVISYIADKLAARSYSDQKTFGFKRAEILAAMINAGTLVFVGGFLIYEGVSRLFHPEQIGSGWVIGLAVFSIVGNTLCVILLKGDAEDNLNIKSAYLHLLTDVMTSVAVLVGGLLMSLYQIYWVDSVLSILIALYLIRASWGILMETLRVVMQFAPAHLDIREIEKTILTCPEIRGMHHIHLWQIDDKTVNLEAHLQFKEDVKLSESNRVVNTINALLQETFDINHTIFQTEFNTDHPPDLLYNPTGQ